MPAASSAASTSTTGAVTGADLTGTATQTATETVKKPEQEAQTEPETATETATSEEPPLMSFADFAKCKTLAQVTSLESELLPTCEDADSRAACQEQAEAARQRLRKHGGKR